MYGENHYKGYKGLYVITCREPLPSFAGGSGLHKFVVPLSGFINGAEFKLYCALLITIRGAFVGDYL